MLLQLSISPWICAPDTHKVLFVGLRQCWFKACPRLTYFMIIYEKWYGYFEKKMMWHWKSCTNTTNSLTSSFINKCTGCGMIGVKNVISQARDLCSQFTGSHIAPTSHITPHDIYHHVTLYQTTSYNTPHHTISHHITHSITPHITSHHTPTACRTP